MPAKSPVQYTIRGIPPEVDRELRRRAHQRQISLNQLVLEELTDLTGARSQRKYRSLQGVAGTWKHDREFDRVLEEQRQIDWELWR